jgi:hypothetical protein
MMMVGGDKREIGRGPPLVDFVEFAGATCIDVAQRPMTAHDLAARLVDILSTHLHPKAP